MEGCGVSLPHIVGRKSRGGPFQIQPHRQSIFFAVSQITSAATPCSHKLPAADCKYYTKRSALPVVPTGRSPPAHRSPKGAPSGAMGLGLGGKGGGPGAGAEVRGLRERGARGFL